MHFSGREAKAESMLSYLRNSGRIDGQNVNLQYLNLNKRASKAKNLCAFVGICFAEGSKIKQTGVFILRNKVGCCSYTMSHLFSRVP